MTARGHGDERTTIRYAELVLRENALRVYRDGRDTW
jgi:hypothetical protein